MQTLPAVLGMEEVVELLGLSAATVRQLVKDGYLQAHRPPGGRKWLFRADEVLDNVSSWSSGEEDDVAPPASAKASGGGADAAEVWCPAPLRSSEELQWLDECAAAWCQAAGRAGLDPHLVNATTVEVDGRSYDLRVSSHQSVRVIDDEGDEAWQPIDAVCVAKATT